MEYGPDISSDVGYEVFPSPPLKAMLGQIQFPPSLKVSDVSAVGRFHEAIRDRFPEFAPEQQFNIMLGPAGPQNAAVSQVYRFTTADGTWSIVLTQQALTLEVALDQQYTNYEEFIGHLRPAWEAAVEHFEPSRVTRQGLRYVDHIEGERSPTEWSEYLNAELLGPTLGVLGAGLERIVTEMRFQREDGTLVFKHGILPTGPEDRWGYLLDYDYFDESPADAAVASVVGRFESYHTVLYAFFRWCVTDKALEEFRRAAR